MVKYQGCRQEENFWIILKFWKNLLIKRAKNLLLSNSDGSRSKFVDPGRVGSAIYGLGLDLENFPQKMSNFSIGWKKISSGRVKKYQGQWRVSLLFTVDQKYAQVGLGQGPSLLSNHGFWKKSWHKAFSYFKFQTLRSFFERLEKSITTGIFYLAFFVVYPVGSWTWVAGIKFQLQTAWPLWLLRLFLLQGFDQSRFLILFQNLKLRPYLNDILWSYFIDINLFLQIVLSRLDFVSSKSFWISSSFSTLWALNCHKLIMIPNLLHLWSNLVA